MLELIEWLFDNSYQAKRKQLVLLHNRLTYGLNICNNVRESIVQRQRKTDKM